MPTRSPTLNSQLALIIAALLATLLLPVRATLAEQSLTAETVIVYNKAAPDSAELARFYAKQRDIALDHIVGVTCSTDEEITREEYDTNIAAPLREAFEGHEWWKLRETAENTKVVDATSIRFVALIKGMPLKIKPVTAPYEGDKPGGGPISDHNEASVDSELTVLGLFSRQISGPMGNPYFDSFKPIVEVNNPVQLLVCRLDAPDTATVRQMIVDSVAAEKRGLRGRAYVDGAHETATGYADGEHWLAEISVQLHKVGVPVVYDNAPALFPQDYPMTDCALYYGWRTDNASGPFAQSTFRFVPGAVAVHIHSFSGATLRDPNSHWVAPLLARGAAATLGNVYEPFLQFTSHVNILNDRLLHGFTFAESAYASINVLSWMSVMVGDPLYRPFASWLQLDAASDSVKTDSWKTYHDFAVENYRKAGAQYRMLARQTAMRARNCAMLEDLGSMEANDGNFGSATTYFGQARGCYSNRDDILRVVLEEADAWNKLKKPKRGIDLLRSSLRIAGDAPAAALLRNLEQQLRGTSRTATPAPSGKPTPRVRVRF